MGPFRAVILAAVLGLAGCAHAPPEIVQVFDQVNRVYEPGQGWSFQLSVFVQANSRDGKKVFDRLHLIHNEGQLVVSVGAGQWTEVDAPGEFWVGTNGLTFPEGLIPPGAWRAMLVTRDGQKVEATFQVPPPVSVPKPRTEPVELRKDPKTPGKFRVTGWVDDTLCWFRDGKGAVVGRTKVYGPDIVVPPGVSSVTLYSYDNNRGEGLEAGPFPVQGPGESADR